MAESLPPGGRGAHPPLWGGLFHQAESNSRDAKKYPVNSRERPGIGRRGGLSGGMGFAHPP